MLLGALPLEVELHKRSLSLLNSVITSDNECLQGLVQRQLAYSFNVKSSFFYITYKILEKNELPSLSQLLCSSSSKLQRKHTYVKEVNKFWSRQFVSEIKTKKTLEYHQIDNLMIRLTHLVWHCLDSTVSDVRQGITNARILTRTFYLLQKPGIHSVVEQ